MSNTPFIGFMGSRISSKHQLKSHCEVKRRGLVVFDQDIQTLPNFIDLCIQILFG